MKFIRVVALAVVFACGLGASAEEVSFRQGDIPYIGGSLNGAYGSAQINLGLSASSISEVRLRVWGHTGVTDGWYMSPECPAQVVSWFNDDGEYGTLACDEGLYVDPPVRCTYGISDYGAFNFEHDFEMRSGQCDESSGELSCFGWGPASFEFLLDGEAVLMLSSTRPTGPNFCGKVIAFVDSVEINVTYDVEVTTENISWAAVKALYY